MRCRYLLLTDYERIELRGMSILPAIVAGGSGISDYTLDRNLKTDIPSVIDVNKNKKEVN